MEQASPSLTRSEGLTFLHITMSRTEKLAHPDAGHWEVPTFTTEATDSTFRCSEHPRLLLISAGAQHAESGTSPTRIAGLLSVVRAEGCICKRELVVLTTEGPTGRHNWTGAQVNATPYPQSSPQPWVPVPPKVGYFPS